VLAGRRVPAVQHLGGRDGVLGLGPLSWNLSLLTSGSTQNSDTSVSTLLAFLCMQQ